MGIKKPRKRGFLVRASLPRNPFNCLWRDIFNLWENAPASISAETLLSNADLPQASN
jgi:hypothetical protein